MSVSNFDSVAIESPATSTVAVKTVCEEKVVKVKVPSASVLALNATPYTILAAQGANTLIEFLGATVHKPAGTAYSGIASGEDLAFKYTNASGAQVNTSLETAGFLDQATAQTRIARAIATEYTPVENAALVLHLLSGEITTGDSDLYISARVRVWKNATKI